MLNKISLSCVFCINSAPEVTISIEKGLAAVRLRLPCIMSCAHNSIHCPHLYYGANDDMTAVLP